MTLRFLGMTWFGAAPLAVVLVAGCGDDKPMETESNGSTTSAPTSTEPTSTSPTEASSGSTTEVGTSTSSSSSATTSEPTSGSTGMVGGADCNPKLQDCPDGQKCTAYDKMMLGMGWDADQCVPEPMNGGAVGDPCQIDEGESVFSGLDNCAKGNFCFNFDFMTGKGGACIEFCNEQGECPNTNGGNAGCLEAANMGVLPICLGKCDPLIQDCPDMQGCFGDVSLPFFICAAPDTGMGPGTDNSPCEFTNACAPGFSCQASDTVAGCDPGATGCCTAFCSVKGGPGPCGMGEQCVPFYNMDPPPGLEDVGVCTIPQ